VAGFGVFGAVTAFFMKEQFDWRTCYYIGGVMGLVLLVLRISVSESGLYKQVQKTSVVRGNFLMFFNNRDRFGRYMRCILIGIPVWFTVGVLITFSDQFGKAMGIEGIDPGKAILYQYMAIAFGDMTVGLLSNWLKSRKKALYIFYGILAFFMVMYFTQDGGSPERFYWICAGLGYGTGLSVVYITMSAEQFGTNLRATAAITIPNMVRAAVPLSLLLFRWLRSVTGDYITGGWITALIVMIIAVLAALKTQETFGKDLDFVEK
jgi:MFS transporter, putative metabolite:H+ symporter